MVRNMENHRKWAKENFQKNKVKTFLQRKERNRRYNLKHKDKILEYGRKFREAHKEKLCAKDKLHKLEAKYIFTRYRYSAIKRGYSFLLSIEDVEQLTQQICFYCGISATPRNGIDRKDNLIGYELANCVSCCIVCNKMKVDLPFDEFIKKCSEITKKFLPSLSP